MTSAPSEKPARPLSPHLQIYKPQLTSGLSIFHRMTGAALTLGLPVFVWWLVALTKGPDAYADFLDCAHSTVGMICLIGWSWAFFFHLCTGIRHLFWDAGYLLELKQVYITGWIAVALSALMTAATWMRILGYFGPTA